MDTQLSFRDERPREQKDWMEAIHQNRHPIGLLTDHIDDPRNIGMLFRLADAARLAHIWLLGTDPAVLESRKFKRIARSTLSYVPHSFITPSDIPAIQSQYTLVGLEVTENSIPINQYPLNAPIALVVGNEAQGVSEHLLQLSEQNIHLPMYGVNTSMNVAMAAGIAVYELLMRQ
jgi:tRNA G18 (ribose-2'-O)-methylase SpoU